jgi:energy-converting hydrogenase B subunit D
LMLWILNLILLVLLLVTSIAAVLMKDLLRATIILSGQGLLMALVWTRLGAPDLALIYVALGVAVSTVMLVIAINRTARNEDGE